MFRWSGEFHDLCPSCANVAQTYAECVCQLLAEAEHNGANTHAELSQQMRKLLVEYLAIFDGQGSDARVMDKWDDLTCKIRKVLEVEDV